MNKEGILKKALEIATINGYKGSKRIIATDYIGSFMYVDLNVIYNHDFAKALWGEEESEKTGYINVWYTGIYDTEDSTYTFDEFIKLFGQDKFNRLSESPKGEIHSGDNTILFEEKIVKIDWKHHLQQMVIAEDPIAYLNDNLPKE